MTSRERALAVYSFQQPDIPCFDLMEGAVWPSIAKDFADQYGMTDVEEIQTALGSDFRWTIFRTYYLPEGVSEDQAPEASDYSDAHGPRLLASARTRQDVRDILRLDPNRVVIPDFAAFRSRHPDKALICCPGWMAAFSSACRDFGMVQAMSLMLEQPEVIEEYVRIKGEYALEVIRRCIAAGAAEHCDFFWLGDDFSAETAMLLSPKLWRDLFKESLRQQVQEARDAGLLVMFHSCGDVSEIYEDFIEIGINAHVGVQTSCPNLAPEKLAAQVGGRLVVHGGVDAQTTLVEEDFDGVAAQVRRNLKAFEGCGGYVVSNSHYGMEDIGAEKIVAMSVGAGRWTPPRG